MTSSALRDAPRVVVRDARSGDGRAVARIARRAFPHTYRTTVPAAVLDAILDQAYAVDALERCIVARRNNGYFLVAERDGAVVGYLDFEHRAPDADAELHRIYVDPDLTGHAIGKRLLDGLHARLDHGTSYSLVVFEGNAGARRFYAREGFAQADRIDARDLYARCMGVKFAPGTPEVPCLVLRRSVKDFVTDNHKEEAMKDKLTRRSSITGAQHLPLPA